MRSKKRKKAKWDNSRMPVSVKERLDLWDRAFNQDDTKALMKLCHEREITTTEDYEYYLKLEQEIEDQEK